MPVSLTRRRDSQTRSRVILKIRCDSLTRSRVILTRILVILTRSRVSLTRGMEKYGRRLSEKYLMHWR